LYGSFGNFPAAAPQYTKNVDTNAALVDAMRRGDEQAFAALYAAHHRAIYRYALQMCGAAAADDVVQETFTALLRDRAFDPQRGGLAAYLFGIARHHILRRLSIARVELSFDEESDAPITAASSFNPLEDMSRAEAIASVRTAIATLPPAYREVVVLCELQDVGYAVAAEVLQCPIGTVRSRLHRARALLTTKLEALARDQGDASGARVVAGSRAATRK
jgi:RNA polymerase sigma-70 factor (ECF subfamily)